MRLNGQLDTALTENGQAQAAELGKALGNLEFAAVYASDQFKDIHTARIIVENSAVNPDLMVNQNMDLRGVGCGYFDGELRPDGAGPGRPHGRSAPRGPLRLRDRHPPLGVPRLRAHLRARRALSLLRTRRVDLVARAPSGAPLGGVSALSRPRLLRFRHLRDRDRPSGRLLARP